MIFKFLARIMSYILQT